jgi:DNA-binding response OmpR family regulator
MNRILVVDDEKGIVFALEKYFAQHGFQVDTATDAETAKELLRNGSYALAILDVHLSGRTDLTEGLDLAATIRETAPGTAVILMTALGTPETEQRATEVGAHSFVRKPARLSSMAEIAFGLIGAGAPVA